MQLNSINTAICVHVLSWRVLLDLLRILEFPRFTINLSLLYLEITLFASTNRGINRYIGITRVSGTNIGRMK